MATLPPDPYAPDPIREPDGTPVPDDQPEALPGPDDIEPGDPGDAPSDTPTQTQVSLCTTLFGNAAEVTIVSHVRSLTRKPPVRKPAILQHRVASGGRP